MEKGMTEFWIAKSRSLDHFKMAFAAKFPDGTIEEKNPADVRPGFLLLHLQVPFEKHTEVCPFLREYAEEQKARIQKGLPCKRSYNFFDL